MQERNIIGGFTAAVLSPFVDGWQRIIWFLLLAVILILGDLRFGIAAAQRALADTAYQKIAMELYLQVLNMRVFENVDEIYVPDYAFMQVFGAAFGSNFSFGDSSSVKYLREQVDKNDKKEDEVVVI